MTTTNTIINPTCLAPAGPFSHGIVVPAGQEIVYTAGQIGSIDAKGTIARTYEDQVIAAIRNLHVVLKEAGGTPKDIVKLTYYIVDYGLFPRPSCLNCNTLHF
jgi:enamine deaminase RidA (YjgF/YER057c/UK114 family)